MIRQMGISPGIMNFYTFGTLNHPNEPQHLLEIIAELVGVKAAVDDYEPTFKMIPNELVTSYVEALVEKTIKSSYHDASKCVFVFKKAIWVGCVYPTKNVKFGIFS